MLANFSQNRVLIVDDAKANIDILVAALREDCSIRVATSGAAALAQVKNDPPDLILLDIIMPGMDGYELCAKIKANPGTSSIPVIFITAMNETKDKSRGFKVGAVDYITKPFQIAEVKARVRTHLALKNAMQVLADQNRILDDKVKKRTQELNQSNRLLRAMNSIQSQYISGAGPDIVFGGVLDTFLTVSESEYGFIGEVFHNPGGKPYLKCYAFTNIAWDSETRKRLETSSSTGFELHNLQTLYGHVILTGQPVTANDPASDSRRGSLPKGHPPIHKFLGLPLHSNGELIGMIGIANRPAGYHDTLIDYLQPLLSSCASFIEAYRNDRRRREAEQALRESEIRFRHIYENSPVMMHSINEDGLIVSANKRWLEETGYAREEVIGRGLDFLMTPESRSMALTTVIPRFWQNGYVRSIPYQYIRKDGSVIDVLLNCDATVDPNGRRVSLSVVENVTERKKAEEALEKSRAMLQTVFNGISEPLIMLDRELNVKMFNLAARDYYKLVETENLFGRPCFEAFMGFSSSCDGCAAPFNGLRNYAGTFERKGAMDPTRTEKVTVYCVKDENGEQEAAILRISDVTQAKIMERQLIQNEKLAALGLLVSGIAHEINNPNNFITFNIPILRDYLQSLIQYSDRYAADHHHLEICGMHYQEFREDIFKLIDNMEHGANRINATVSGLKEFARKKEKTGGRLINLKEVVQKCVALCKSEIKRKIKSFEVNIPEDLPPIFTDPEAIEQLLVNLLINASQAADKENSFIKLNLLHTSGSSSPSSLVIEVMDNGCGIDDSLKDRLFDPFFTTKSRMGGTGLGLYVCHNLIEGLGGRIEVDSVPHQWTTFRVILPENEESAIDAFNSCDC